MIQINARFWWRVGLVVVGVALIVAGVFWTLDYLSWKDVSFTVASGVKTVEITGVADGENGKGAVIASLTGSGTLRLKTGSYYAYPTGNNLSPDPVPFAVSGEKSAVSINPFLSTSFLASAFSKESTVLDSIFSKKFGSSLPKNFVLDKKTFYHFGDWFSARLYVPNRDYTYDYYAVVAHKVGDAWVFVTKPELVLSYRVYPDIPKDVVYSANLSLLSE